MKYAAIGPIAIYLPERVETNAQLKSEYPDWDMDAIYVKTGVANRHVAAADECSSDLGVKAAEKLFAAHRIDPQSIDFLLFCTQTPDYPLPTTACLVQHRLGLKTSCGALDFNLGCSGYIYGLSLADGLIRSGVAKRVLLITAETYSKFIDRGDRSLRTVFGDGAAATLVESADQPSLAGFVFGTDGRGADALIVNRGGFRTPEQAIQPRRRQRWQSPLYMHGPSLITFATESIPQLVDAVLTSAQIARADIDLYLFHQATRLMLDKLREGLNLPSEQLPLALENCGNTVSSTVPILIEQQRTRGQVKTGTRSLLIGFGVGYSWAGCAWTETWQDQRL